MINISYNTNTRSYEVKHKINESLFQKTSINGLITCYALIIQKSFSVISLDLKSKNFDTSSTFWRNIYTYRSFLEKIGSLQNFIDKYNREDFGTWTTNINFKDKDISVSGNKDDNNIIVKYSSDSEIDLSLLYKAIEEQLNNFLK
jgi:hypothetical protein